MNNSAKEWMRARLAEISKIFVTSGQSRRPQSFINAEWIQRVAKNSTGFDGEDMPPAGRPTGKIIKDVMKNTITVKFVTYARNAYDGSVYVKCFKNAADAETFAVKDDERFDEDIQTHTLEFDMDGNLLDKK